MLGSLTLLPAILGWVGHRIDNTSRAALIAVGLRRRRCLLRRAHQAGSDLPRRRCSPPIVLFAVSFAVKPLRQLLPHRHERPSEERVLVPVEPLRPAPPVADRHRRCWPCSCCSPYRCSPSGLASATTATTPRTRRCAGRTTCWPRAFGEGTNGPSVHLGRGRDGRRRAGARRRSSARSTGPTTSTPPSRTAITDQLALVIVYPESAPQAAPRPRPSSRRCATTSSRPAASTPRSAESPPAPSTSRRTSPAACHGSSVPCSSLSFLLLMAVFRSVLVPLKAVVMNLLSIGAAYGDHRRHLPVGVAEGASSASTGPVRSTRGSRCSCSPSCSACRWTTRCSCCRGSRRSTTAPSTNATAVADGLAATARVITAAALIMFCVFGAFVLGDDRALKLFGLGLAIAVLIDATVVRMLLVPATMELLGDRNWWMPSWLDRILPKIEVEGQHHIAPVPRLASWRASPEDRERTTRASRDRWSRVPAVCVTPYGQAPGRRRVAGEGQDDLQVPRRPRTTSAPRSATSPTCRPRAWPSTSTTGSSRPTS